MAKSNSLDVVVGQTRGCSPIETLEKVRDHEAAVRQPVS